MLIIFVAIADVVFYTSIYTARRRCGLRTLWDASLYYIVIIIDGTDDGNFDAGFVMVVVVVAALLLNNNNRRTIDTLQIEQVHIAHHLHVLDPLPRRHGKCLYTTHTGSRLIVIMVV